jgi:monoterpene epsilon-lactone hydrolase
VLRQRLEAVALPVEKGVSVTELDLGGVPVERVAWEDVDSPGGVLYLHGRGYCLGSPRTHRKLAADISRSVGLPCFVVDYRLAPEYPLLAATEDAVAAYTEFLHSFPAASLR